MPIIAGREKMPTVDERYTLSYMTLRQAIGWLGLFMPLSVRLGGWIFEGIFSTDSISAYYYTDMRDFFVSTMVLVGVLLACYRTPEKQDTWVGLFTGLAAIGIGVFPLDPTFAPEIIRKYPDMISAKCYLNEGLLGFHFYFVVAFSLLAFYLVYFRFRALTPANLTPQKMMRNRIYKIAGLAMLAASIAILFLTFYEKGSSIFWPESIAVVAFATAWLVKGQVFMGDRTN
jgi:hypothetical protein